MERRRRRKKKATWKKKIKAFERGIMNYVTRFDFCIDFGVTEADIECFLVCYAPFWIRYQIKHQIVFICTGYKLLQSMNKYMEVVSKCQSLSVINSFENIVSDQRSEYQNSTGVE